jgi:ATP-binding cassette, subfamily B, multidrug efflux pump
MKQPDRISHYFKSEIGVLIIVTVSGLIYNIGLLAGPYFQGKLIDAVAQGQHLRPVLLVSLLFIAVIAVVQTARAVKRFYVRRFANDVNAQMQNVIYKNIVNESEDNLLNGTVGSLMTKAVSDVDACVEGMRKFTTEIFDTGVFLVSYFIALSVYDWKLTLVSCACIPPALFIAGKLRKVIVGYTSSWRKSVSKVANTTYDYVNNAMLYRINGRESDNCTAYEELNKDYEKKAVLANIWENSMMPLYKIISLIGVIAIVIAGADKVTAGIWTVGKFTAYITMFIALAEKTSHAGKLFNSVQKAEVSWKRIKPFMQNAAGDTTVDTKITVEVTTESPETYRGPEAVSLEHVSFSWAEGNPLIKDLSFGIKCGQMLGMTGPVACGKSSLARIFLGGKTYGGSIKLCSRELSEIPDNERIKLVSYMGHEASLMSASIYDNVTLGDGGDIADVLHAVCFDADLASMHDGIQTLVGNGGRRLSGGQQERIALARTLYHKAPLIILDDPFASVDRTVEQQILADIRTKYSECAVLLISHRLSQFRSLDSVLLLEGNGAYTYSSHEKLIKTSEIYRELYELQEVKNTKEEK